MTRKQTREERALRHVIERFGFVILGYARGRHHRFLVESPDGTTGIVVGSVSPSDQNARRQFIGDLKRLARGGA